MLFLDGNFIKLLSPKGLYFEILILCSMTESIIQPESFLKDSYVFNITVI